MFPLPKWCILSFFLIFVIHLSSIEANPAEEIFNVVASCLKHNRLGYNIPKFSSCSSTDLKGISEACIQEISAWLQSKEENYINILKNEKGKVIAPSSNKEEIGDILDSTQVTLIMNEIRNSGISSGKVKPSCPNNCSSRVVNILQRLEVPSEIMNKIQSFLCNNKSFTMETCIESVELSIEDLLDQDNKKMRNLHRSTALKICYNIGIVFGRSPIFLGHIFDLIAFDLSIQEQLGVSISQLTGKNFKKLSLESEIIYIFDSIRQIKINEIYRMENNNQMTGSEMMNSSRTKKDVLDVNFSKTEDQFKDYSFDECQFGSDLLLKLYLIPMQKSEFLCKLFFLYRGLTISQEKNNSNQILELMDSRKALKTQVESSLMKFGVKKEAILRLSRFKLFNCIESLLDKKLNLEISVVSATCYFIYKKVNKDMVELFDVNTASYVSLALIWLSKNANYDFFPNISSSEKAIYTTTFVRSVTYSLLQTMSDGFDLNECKRHLEILNNHKPFLSQEYHSNPEFPFNRLMNPSPIRQDYINLVCNEKSIIFQMFSKINPFREFITTTQPTMLSFKTISSGENSKESQKNVMGTKEIFDTTLQLYFAGDVPRGYLMDAVSFSIVGLKAFLRNTLTFLSQEAIMAKYNDIQNGKIIVTPFSDVLSLMGISGCYNNQLNTQEQLMFTNKYICNGSSENIDVRIKDTNIVKYVGSPYYVASKDFSNTSGNMFSFMNCVDEFILISWSNSRYSLLKSDPVMFCSLIGVYLARDYTYIQSEINKYAIHVTYYEITGNILPQKCMEVNFSSIPYIKDIRDNTILSKAFIDCLEKYSTLTDFIPKNDLKYLSEIFSVNVLQYVDKPMALHRSSTYRRLLTYILYNYPKIGKDKALKIISSLNPIYGFNYDQLFSTLTENNIPFKESSIITGFVANQLDGDTNKLDFDFINWLRDYSGYYLPFENHPGLKENVLKLFTEQEVLEKSNCVKSINELFDKFQVPLDTSTELICDEWVTLFENYPRKKSYDKFLNIIHQNMENQKDTINLLITRTHPIGISTKVSVSYKDVPLVSLIPILTSRGLLDPKKEAFKGFQTESQTLIFVDQENEMDISAETLGLNDGDLLTLIVEHLEPEVFNINVSWKDTNTRKEGSFLLTIKDKSLRQFLEELNKREELKDRTIKFILLPNGKMLDPQSDNLDQDISKYGFGTSNKIELVTLLKNVSLLNLRLIWRNPSIIEVIPSIDEKDNLKENFLSKEIQISSNEISKNLFNDIKSVLMDETFTTQDKFGVDKFEVASVEILEDIEKTNTLLLNRFENVIQNNPEKHNLLISELGINDHDQILVNLRIEPFKTVNIVSKTQKLSYNAKITSIPYNFQNESEPQFGLFHVLNIILDNNINLYDIMIHEKYFMDKKEAKNSKGHYINISSRIKTFNLVEKLTPNSLILLNNKKLVKKQWTSLIVILKDFPDISRTIRFQNVMTSNKVSDLLKKNFGNHIKPGSLFTKNGKEIKVAGNNMNIIFGDIPLKDNDILYLTCIKTSFDVVDMKEKSSNPGEISFQRVEELLNSYGYIIQNSSKTRGILDNNEIMEYPKKFNDFPHLEVFVRQLIPSMNSERLISESQEYILQLNYRFPTALERLIPLLTEDFLGLPVSYNLINELNEKYGLLNAKEGDMFDFLGCIRSFRNFFFYNRPKKVIYSARIYNVCKKIGNAFFRRESWLMEQGITGAFVSILEEEILHPIKIESEDEFFNSVDLFRFIGTECVETLNNSLEKLYLTSLEIKDLEIPVMVNYDQVCMQIQSFVNNYDESTGEYENVVQVLPSYRISQIIDSLFPKFWEENTFGALLPNISEVKYATTPLFDFSKVFKFIKVHLEIHLKLLKEYPNCIILLTVLLIRNIMISSSINPLVFVRKLVQFALEREYEETKELNMNVSQILSILKKNTYLFSTDSKYNTGDSWIWDTVKGNQNLEILDLGAKLKYSNKLLLIFKESENLCPVSTVSEDSNVNIGDDIQALIKFFTENILKNNTGEGLERGGILEEFKINDLALIAENLDQFRVDSFYKIIKKDIMEVIKKNTKEMKKAIGYSDVGNYDHEYVPFIVAFNVILNSNLNKKHKKDLMYDFLKFFVQEIFLSLGIIIGNIETKHITNKILENFDWNKMSISKNKLLSVLIEVSPINSANFIDTGNIKAISEISDLIIDILESKEPIKVAGFKAITTNNNLDFGLTPRAHFYRFFKKSNSKLNEDSIESINGILSEKEGYPENLLKAFNNHLVESVRILNSEVVHVGRLGKMRLSPRQEHIGAIFLSYGYSNLQLSSFLNNFDHNHCFSSVLDIITDEPKRLDHYYQICMSICIEVDEISYYSCERLLIQSIVSTLLSNEWPQSLKRLISFLKYDYIFDHDLKILNEIYLDKSNKRISEKWVDLIKSMKYSSNIYTIIKKFKPYIDQILSEKNIKEPSSGFGLIDLIGELISCWTRESGEDYIKKFLINQGYPIELLKPFSNIWPGDGRNRINLKVVIPRKETLKKLKTSLQNEIQLKGVDTKKDSESLIDEMIEKMTQSILGVNIKLVGKIPNSMHKLNNVKMAENGVDIENLISKLDKNGPISIYLSLNECILETNKQIINHLDLSYSDILSFCVWIVSEISHKKMSNFDEINQNSFLSNSINTRSELYFVTVFYGFQFALNRIFQGFISKNKIKEYLLLMKHNLYQLNNELGILNFFTGFVIKFRLPLDPSILSYYLKEVILNFNSGVNLDKSDEIKIYQNVPDIVITNKGFHKLVFEITKKLFDQVGDDLEEDHFKLLFKQKDIQALIEKGFNPINIQEFISKITNNDHRNILFEFGKKLGMNSLNFKLVYIHKILQSKILEILNDREILKDQRQFFTIINSNLSPIDKFVYEMIYTSRENCVVETIRRYTNSIKEFKYGPHFEYAFNFCDELLNITENITKEIDNAFGLDYFGNLANCDRIRINEEVEQLRLDINIILNYLNNFGLITSLFEIKQKKDLKLEKSIRYVEKKIENKSNKAKILRVFNKWDEPTNKKILLEIKIRKNIFNTILSYMDNHVFVVVPMFRKISDLLKKNMDIINYQKVKKTLSKLVLTLVTIKDPYSVPSIMKNNYKMTAEYLREVKNYKAKISSQENKDINIFGISLLPYYLKICWYVYYLSKIVEETNVLLNQLPNFKVGKNKKKSKMNVFDSHIKFKKNSKKDHFKLSSLSKISNANPKDDSDINIENKNKRLKIFKIINKFFKKRLKPKKL